MVTITLPPELEQVATEEAARQGTTPELWALDKLRQSVAGNGTFTPPDAEGGTMLDFLSGYVGVLDSGEVVPGGAQMSTLADDAFAATLDELLQQARELAAAASPGDSDRGDPILDKYRRQGFDL